MTDTTGLKAYYKKNKENYMWEKRYNGYIVSAATKDMAEEVIDMLDDEDRMTDILAEVNEESKEVSYGVEKAGSNEVMLPSSL